MTKTMLIDAANQEEVRVCVLENGKVEDFDFEYSSRKPLRGNIYLARVTRVEPSLQAAFVEYGGNRHGFLAFSEIHPDYYQVPVSDRRAIQEAEAEEAALAAALNLTQRGDDDDDDDGGIDEIGDDAGEQDGAIQNLGGDDDDQPEVKAAIADAEDVSEDDGDAAEDADDDAPGDDGDAGEDLDEEEEEEEHSETNDVDDKEDDDGDDKRSNEDDDALNAKALADADEEDDVENGVEDQTSETAYAGSEDAKGDEDSDDDEEVTNENASDAPLSELSRSQLLDRYKEARRKKARLLRNYKIQEVIKRRQILLIQVVKEERGNKGAALTTYLSLAGRYCVLMPNTARGGGISRKIPVAADRKRLRRVVDGLDVPDGMGLIIRTAGAKRTKAEIKRDYEYLVRLWENIRALTLKSIAPSLIYEEANLIKRAIRDLYDKDIKKVLVEGDAGYREAKDFMKMLMPSHAKNVQPYKETAPLFLRYNVESQLDAMYQPSVRLKSGGYIVINQTEALIAIDVNSGKATRERNIEQTALRTNLEAADEAARQCRMRDLAGLIVIDFIDMDEQRNNRAVERRLKDALKNDRARIQLGRISNFGLLEMSRQRRRSGIVDGTTHACPTCGGAGAVRSQEMAALRILRAVEGEAISSKAGHLQVRAALDVALYVLNHKRDWLARISNDYGVTVEITADSSKAGDQYEVDKTGVRKENYERPAAVRADSTEAVEIETDTAEDEIAARDADDEKADADGESRRGKRRRRRKRKDAPPAKADDDASANDSDSGDGEQPDVLEASQSDDENGKSKKRRRRGRRGGRRSKRDQEPAVADNAATQEGEQPAVEATDETGADADVKQAEAAENTDAKVEPDAPAAEIATTEPEIEDVPAADEPAPQAATAEPEPVEIVDQSPKEPKGPPKKGWWQRAVGG